jgi:hypothetical protein
MDIALANGHSGTVYITKLQAQGHKVTRKNEFEVSASDSTSQTTFGKRSYPHPGKFVPDAEEAQNWATFHLSAWKDPVPLLKVTMVGNRSTATLTDIMSREISDLVTVTASNSAGLGISEGFFIEQVHHTLDAQLNHRASFLLSQSSGYAGFFLVGTLPLGTQQDWHIRRKLWHGRLLALLDDRGGRYGNTPESADKREPRGHIGWCGNDCWRYYLRIWGKYDGKGG